MVPKIIFPVFWQAEKIPLLKMMYFISRRRSRILRSFRWCPATPPPSAAAESSPSPPSPFVQRACMKPALHKSRIQPVPLQRQPPYTQSHRHLQSYYLLARIPQETEPPATWRASEKIAVAIFSQPKNADGNVPTPSKRKREGKEWATPESTGSLW